MYNLCWTTDPVNRPNVLGRFEIESYFEGLGRGTHLSVDAGRRSHIRVSRLCVPRRSGLRDRSCGGVLRLRDNQTTLVIDESPDLQLARRGMRLGWFI